MEPLPLFLVGLVFSMAMMFAVWAWAMRIRNAGIVDVAWSLGFTPLVLLYVVLGNGWLPRKALIAAMVLAWSLRLGLHLWVRVGRHHPAEDERYAVLREQFPKNTNLMFLGFFELQAVLLAVLSLPFLFAAAHGVPSLSAWEIAGVVLWMIGLGGESLADAQLKSFKADSQNRGRTCRAGLWRFSRHPNYFFEWVIWVAYFVFACGSPWGWVSVVCPLLMLFFLLKVSGIPPAEAQSLRSRGDEYRAYQRETSVFIPWFPKT